MKNLIKITFTLALSAMLFFSCSKDDTVTKSKEKVNITLSADKDGISSKTAAVEGESSASYIWTDEDAANIKLFTVTGNTLTEVTNPTVTKVSEKNLTITAAVEPGQSYTFRAILCKPANYSGTNPKVADAQTPNGTSGFDPNADILVSDDLVVDVAADGSTTANLDLKFHRKVVVNKMTLRNMPVDEKISKVEISSDMDLTGVLNNGTMTGNGKKITLTYNNVEVPSNGEFPVYFISMANSSQTLTVKVTTDKDVYSKTFTKTIDLIQGQFTRFGARLPKTATIYFGSKTTSTAINAGSVTGPDSKNNSWTITTNPTGVDYSQSSNYSQIGDESGWVASSITFETNLPNTSKIHSMSITLRTTADEAYGTNNKVSLSVGGGEIGSGNVPDGSNPVTISASVDPESVSGKALKITVTNIVGGIQVHAITIVYE